MPRDNLQRCRGHLENSLLPGVEFKKEITLWNNYDKLWEKKLFQKLNNFVSNQAFTFNTNSFSLL
jgi:uncharacterized iron-regulated protein